MYDGRILGDGQWLHGFPYVGMGNGSIASRMWGMGYGSTASPGWGWVWMVCMTRASPLPLCGDGFLVLDIVWCMDM